MSQEIPEEISTESEVSVQPVDSHSPKSFSFSKLNESLSTIFSFSLKLGGLLLFIILFFVFVQEVKFRGYTLEEMDVPSSFEEQGFSDAMMATNIEENLSRLIETIRKPSYLDLVEGVESSEYAFNEKESELQVGMAGVELPVRSLVRYLAGSFGYSNKKRIKAYVAYDSGKAFLKLLITGKPVQEMAVNMDSLGMKKSVDALCVLAAEHILKMTNPVVLSKYYYDEWNKIRRKRNGDNILWGDKVIAQCEYAIANTSDSLQTKSCYLQWGYVLSATFHKYPEAAAKIEKAIQMDPGYLSGYFWLNGVYGDEGNWEAFRTTAERYKKAIEMESMPNSKKKIFIKDYYTLLGVYFEKVKKYDSGIVMYRKIEAMKEVIDLTRNKGGTIVTPSMQKENVAIASNMIAFMFSESGRYDSALLSAHKAIQADSNYVFTYTTIAEVYGYQREKELFYGTLEKAFMKGYNASYVNENISPYSFYRDEPRFKELIKKNVRNY